MDPAITVVLAAGEFNPEVIGDGHQEIAARAPSVERRDLAFHAAFKLISRRLGDDIDGAAGGVPAVQCPLGTAQNLDPVYIDKLENVAGSASLVYPVDVNTDCLICADTGNQRTYPANNDGIGAETRVAAYPESRREQLHFPKVRCAGLLELFPGKGGNGHGGILQVGFPFGGRDHDFLQ